MSINTSYKPSPWSSIVLYTHLCYEFPSIHMVLSAHSRGGWLKRSASQIPYIADQKRDTPPPFFHIPYWCIVQFLHMISKYIKHHMIQWYLLISNHWDSDGCTCCTGSACRGFGCWYFSGSREKNVATFLCCKMLESEFPGAESMWKIHSWNADGYGWTSDETAAAC